MKMTPRSVEFGGNDTQIAFEKSRVVFLEFEKTK